MQETAKKRKKIERDQERARKWTLWYPLFSLNFPILGFTINQQQFLFQWPFLHKSSLLFCPVSYFWIFKVEENAKLKKKKKKKNYKNPLPGTYIGKRPKTETLTIPKHIGTIIYEANPDVSFHPYNFCEPQALYYKLPLHLVVSWRLL